MYLPPEGMGEAGAREDISRRFREVYGPLHYKMGRQLKDPAAIHWAKLEVPEDPEEVRAVREDLANKYPVDIVNYARWVFDRKGVLSNSWVEALFGQPAPMAKGGEPKGRNPKNIEE
mmetsp:Transcript_21646/g.49246  ORF Transcript_21646/g.49246 Transcript_21646/m.49246 type:complete len:117 (-) Transcript_21646:70-420(-)